MAAFCWVTESISATAVFTWPMPLLCSAAPLLISSITSVTRATLSTIPRMVSPAWRTSSEPSRVRDTEVSIKARISRAASPARPARLRTSSATTAKPRPCSPARAASTEALRARMLVWKAMPSIRVTISFTRVAESLISPMVVSTWPITARPSPATFPVPATSLLA